MINNNPMSEKISGKKTPLLIAAAAVVAAGSVAGYLYFKGLPGKSSTPLESAKLVPDEALMTAFVTTDSQTWSKLKQFGSPEAQKLVTQGLQNFQAQMLADSNLNYEKDLKPWVGGVMFAIMPSPEKAAGAEPNVLMVVGIQNKLKALEFANRLKAQEKGKVEEKQYKGITVSNVKEENGTNYNTAVLGDHLLLAFQPEILEDAIDTFKGEPSFASKGDVATGLAKGAGVQNPIAQVYVSDWASVIKQYASSNPEAPQLPATTLKQLEQVKSVVMGLGVDNEGLRLKADAQMNPQAITQEFKPAPGTVVSEFPAETMALVTGHKISEYWSQMVAQSKDSPEIKASVDQVRQSVKDTVNLDADKEIFGWMDGEFGLGVISSNQGILAQFGFGSALVVETGDRKTAESTFNKLGVLVKQNLPFLSIDQRKIGDKEVTEWKIPQGTLLGHGWLDDNSLFVALGPLVDVIANKPANPLDSSPSFKAIAGSLPKTNQGYFYLDMDRTMSIVNSFTEQSGNPISPEASAILNSMRGVGVTATWENKTTNQLEMLFALKRDSK